MDTDGPRFDGLEGALAWARSAPKGASLPVSAVVRLLEDVQDSRDETRKAQAPLSSDRPWTWREKLWDTPSETRLGVIELAEAVGRSKSWIRKQARAGEIPARKQGQAFVFLAGEVRHWVRESEEVVNAGPSDPPVGRLNFVDGQRDAG